jgi:YD repeat-containing protein
VVEFSYNKYGQLKSKRMIENSKIAEKQEMEK